MKRLLLLTVLSISVCLSLYADPKYPLSIGMGGGYTDFRSLGGEVYAK